MGAEGWFLQRTQVQFPAFTWWLMIKHPLLTSVGRRNGHYEHTDMQAKQTYTQKKINPKILKFSVVLTRKQVGCSKCVVLQFFSFSNYQPFYKAHIIKEIKIMKMILNNVSIPLAQYLLDQFEIADYLYYYVYVQLKSGVGWTKSRICAPFHTQLALDCALNVV